VLLINCPWCGPRDEMEFHCGGESHIACATSADRASDAEWADYLFNRSNPKGLILERWVHDGGCRSWFNIARDTVTHEIRLVYKMDEPRPGDELAGSGAPR